LFPDLENVPDALESRKYSAINPDVFKATLIMMDRNSINPMNLKSSDVHQEGSYLADRQFEELLNRTVNGAYFDSD
jgi:hypothetical protein